MSIQDLQRLRWRLAEKTQETERPVSAQDVKQILPQEQGPGAKMEPKIKQERKEQYVKRDKEKEPRSKPNQTQTKSELKWV